MNRGLENALWRIQNSTEPDKDSILSNDSDTPIYSKFITIDVSNQTDIMCPLFCIRHVFEVLTKRNSQNQNTEKIVIPLNVISETFYYYVVHHKSIDSALKDLFVRTDNSLGVFKSIVKDETFYGCAHLLLDNDFNILFMPCVKVDYSNRNYKDYTIVADSSLLYNITTVVRKAIMKKLIPYYVSYPMTFDKFEMVIEQTPTVFFTDLSTNIISSTQILDSPYDILNTELSNLINSIEYVH